MRGGASNFTGGGGEKNELCEKGVACDGAGFTLSLETI